MKKLYLGIVFILLAIYISPSKIIMQPYLQAVTDSSVVVMVECDTKNDVVVRYGTNNELSQTSKTEYFVKTERPGKSFVHRIKLKNLLPDMEYKYNAIQSKSFSRKFSFKTAVKEGTKFSFAVMGDCRSNPGIHNQIASEIQRHKPNISIFLGDLCYNSSYLSWKKEFFVKEQLNLSSSIPFFNAVGNHEGWNQNTKAFQQSPGLAKENSSFYSFNYGDILFVIISTEESVKKGSRQYLYIKQTLEKSDKKWKIVAYHIPALSYGPHNGNEDMIDLTAMLFETNNVDITLAGHNHYYQHNFVNGIRHFVIGGGGAPLYEPVKGKYTIKSSKSYCYAVFDVEENKIIINVYDIGGNVIDKLEINKIKNNKIRKSKL